VTLPSPPDGKPCATAPARLPSADQYYLNPALKGNIAITRLGVGSAPEGSSTLYAGTACRPLPAEHLEHLLKRFLHRLVISCERDDLFLRVVFFLSGLLFGGLGVVMLVYASTHSSTSLLAEVLFWVFGILFTAGGGLMVSRCALSAQSRMARFLDRNLPDAAGLEDGALLLIAIYLPAVLLTPFLRFLGLRGQRSNSMHDNGNRIARPPT